MDSTIKVTVGIPIFNAERFINTAIISVLNQSYKNFELIISDDGSTDKSLDIARSFSDSRIKIITDCQNRGISYRLNEQIDVAQGKYFARMDADDIMFPDRLKMQIEYLEKNCFVDIVGSSAVIINDDNQIEGIRSTQIPKNISYLYKYVPFIHPTVMGKIEWFRQYKYINDLKGVEDVDLWIRSFNTSTFAVINEPLIFYRHPLQIKYKSYKYRIFQLLKLYRMNSHLLGNSKLDLIYHNINALCKLCIYTCLSLLGIESIITHRRNEKLSVSIKEEYLKIMHSILNVSQ